MPALKKLFTHDCVLLKVMLFVTQDFGAVYVGSVPPPNLQFFFDEVAGGVLALYFY
ncbi:MAG: hypothetical protein KME29_33650 [Calothrix sp. FI2-JRJ7]|jgi:hypothetical protein|nr:hypothetical protein [Calothrix sp. FI2-JRJ7]